MASRCEKARKKNMIAIFIDGILWLRDLPVLSIYNIRRDIISRAPCKPFHTCLLDRTYAMPSIWIWLRRYEHMINFRPVARARSHHNFVSSSLFFQFSRAPSAFSFVRCSNNAGRYREKHAPNRMDIESKAWKCVTKWIMCCGKRNSFASCSAYRSRYNMRSEQTSIIIISRINTGAQWTI